MTNALERKCLVACSTFDVKLANDAIVDAAGLVRGHAYTVLDAATAGSFRLLRLRNTWGRTEWKGDWSDDSKMWDQHPEVSRQLKHSTIVNDDGEFWISIDDFVSQYDLVAVCAY